jgi:hypothetical protein
MRLVNERFRLLLSTKVNGVSLLGLSRHNVTANHALMHPPPVHVVADHGANLSHDVTTGAWLWRGVIYIAPPEVLALMLP